MQESTSMRNDNVYAHFRTAFETKLDKILLTTDSGERISYEVIDRESARLANFLAQSGARPGDRITSQIEKSPQALCLYLACLRGGFVYHPLNTGYQSGELEYFLNDAKPVIVVCDSTQLPIMQPIVSQLSRAQLFTLNADGGGTLTDLAHSVSDTPIMVYRDKNDIACLLYSSGTTGVPKGIVLTHDNIAISAQTLAEAWGFVADDVLLHALPIFHVHGLFVALGCVLLSGASMHWLQGFNADKVIALLPECTVMMGVPTYYTRLLNHGGMSRETAASMRLFVSGSAPLLEETFHAFEELTGHRILERYGMTETNMNTSNPLLGIRKPGTVGPPLPGVEIRICDDHGEILPKGEIGNIQVKGRNVFREYWNLPEKTAEDKTADGFFNTGDKGRFDEDGYISIVGRSKDMIISGGLNVYPIEVEGCINDLSGVSESAVIGIPHPDLGEGVVAVVVAKSTARLDEAELIAAIKEKLAGFKTPKRIFFVAELPRNTMGKVQKVALRKAYSQVFTD